MSSAEDRSSIMKAEIGPLDLAAWRSVVTSRATFSGVVGVSAWLECI